MMEVQNEGRGDLHNQRLVLLYPNHQYTTEPHSSLILLPGLRPLLTSLLIYIMDARVSLQREHIRRGFSI